MKKIIQFFVISIFCLAFLFITSQNGYADFANPASSCAMAVSDCMNGSEYKAIRCIDTLQTCIDRCSYDGIDLMNGAQVTEATCQSGEAQACYYCLIGNLTGITETQYSDEAFHKILDKHAKSMNEPLVYSSVFFVLGIITGILLVYEELKKKFKKYRNILIWALILEMVLCILFFMAWFYQPAV